ncbi:MAG: hypothetical protein KA712_15050 [Myxococcales bacterium]|nr:hypothetical protein [Myxococcales bacterium]
MKVNGPGTGLPPTNVESAPASQGANDAAGVSPSVKNEEARAPLPNQTAHASLPAKDVSHLVAGLGNDLKTGRLTTRQALESLVDRVVEHRVGPGATEAVRAQLETALRNALENDPFVGAQLALLTRRHG